MKGPGGPSSRSRCIQSRTATPPLWNGVASIPDGTVLSTAGHDGFELARCPVAAAERADRDAGGRGYRFGPDAVVVAGHGAGIVCPRHAGRIRRRAFHRPQPVDMDHHRLGCGCRYAAGAHPVRTPFRGRWRQSQSGACSRAERPFLLDARLHGGGRSLWPSRYFAISLHPQSDTGCRNALPACADCGRCFIRNLSRRWPGQPCFGIRCRNLSDAPRTSPEDTWPFERRSILPVRTCDRAWNDPSGRQNATAGSRDLWEPIACQMRRIERTGSRGSGKEPRAWIEKSKTREPRTGYFMQM